MNAKPFLKWAGGKSQILIELESRIPKVIRNSGIIDKYVEPFIGGGAFFFWLKNKYEIKQTFLIDINKELILAYKTIQKNPMKLIQELKHLEEMFLKSSNKARKGLFYEIRMLYNDQMNRFDYNTFSDDWAIRSAFFIFLNKTCFNGLFRQNSRGEFNVPYGNYENPKICDEENIIEVSKALNGSEIINGDFEESDKFIGEKTFVYFDPPYRPLSKTSAFTRYSKDDFSDEDQIRLAKFYRRMNDNGAYLLLSNSDPKNTNPEDNFFDKLYKGFKIDRISANRVINRDRNKRGKIREIIITNYE